MIQGRMRRLSLFSYPAEDGADRDAAARTRAARIANMAVFNGSHRPTTETIPALHARLRHAGASPLINTTRSGCGSGKASRSRA